MQTIISDELKRKIIIEYIEPFYINEVKNNIQEKSCWKRTGHVFQTLSKILVASGGILSFSSGYYDYPLLSFISGSISTISLAFLQLSAYSYAEHKKQGQELNTILEKLKIDTLPVLERESNNMMQRVDIDYENNVNDLNNENRLLREELERLRQNL